MAASCPRESHYKYNPSTFLLSLFPFLHLATLALPFFADFRLHVVCTSIHFIGHCHGSIPFRLANVEPLPSRFACQARRSCPERPQRPHFTTSAGNFRPFFFLLVASKKNCAINHTFDLRSAFASTSINTPQ